MALSYTLTTEQTTVRTGYNDPSPVHTTLNRHQFSGRACVALSHSMIQISDPYGESSRQTLEYLSDSDAVAEAVVDWIHALRREVVRAADAGCLGSSPSADRCLETLRRIAGELGYNFNPQPTEVS